MSKTETRIGEILIKRKYITRKQLEQALEKQEDAPLGETLIKMGYVTDVDLSAALTQQSAIQTVREELSDAVRNPVQHKLLWFIVVFALIGIATIYNIVTGTVDQNIGENTTTNIAQDEDINATKVETKKTRLKYIGHDSKLSEQRDTINNVKNRASNFKSDVKAEFKYTLTEIEDLRVFSFEEDSILKEELSDLDDRFFTYRSTSKNDINRLKKENKLLKARIDDLEKTLISIIEASKEESE